MKTRSSGSLVIDSALGSSVLFFRHGAIFSSKYTNSFLLKTDVLFYIKLSKRSSDVTITVLITTTKLIVKKKESH